MKFVKLQSKGGVDIINKLSIYSIDKIQEFYFLKLIYIFFLQNGFDKNDFIDLFYIYIFSDGLKKWDIG